MVDEVEEVGAAADVSGGAVELTAVHALRTTSPRKPSSDTSRLLPPPSRNTGIAISFADPQRGDELVRACWAAKKKSAGPPMRNVV